MAAGKFYRFLLAEVIEQNRPTAASRLSVLVHLMLLESAPLFPFSKAGRQTICFVGEELRAIRSITMALLKADEPKAFECPKTDAEPISRQGTDRH
jgi:hypothetical protein